MLGNTEDKSVMPSKTLNPKNKGTKVFLWHFTQELNVLSEQKIVKKFSLAKWKNNIGKYTNPWDTVKQIYYNYALFGNTY